VENHCVNSEKVHVTPLVSVDFQENSYVAQIEGRKDCLVIDPGLEPELIIDYLERHGLTPGAILITHGHADHIAGNAALKEQWPDCPIVVGTEDAAKLTDPRLNLSALFGLPLRSPPADVTVRDGETYSAAGFDLQVLAIPGHSIGHVVYLWKGQQPYVVFVGDVIFAGSIGRADFPDGDFDALIDGIRSKLYSLPDDTLLYSGHGPVTTVGREKRTNPFVQGA
jgi:glyoxylase-like metal-dependent hydrolase (beta-lactamase superfamily II)